MKLYYTILFLFSKWFQQNDPEYLSLSLKVLVHDMQKYEPPFHAKKKVVAKHIKETCKQFSYFLISKALTDGPTYSTSKEGKEKNNCFKAKKKLFSFIFPLN